jgi:UDP-N-acetylmuramoylalanine--D-glutamate ligase
VRRKHSPLTPFLSHKGRWGVGKIILIAGGSDKNLEFAGMARELKKQKVRLVIFPGKATEKLIAELDKIHYNVSSQPVRDMKSAVNLARSLATRGDIILLSPGAASFGLFQNEFDRGRQFVKIVKELR